MRGSSEAEVQAVGLKAFARIAERWDIGAREAAALLGMSESDWKSAKATGSDVRLGKDQMLRLSALVGVYSALETCFGADLARRWVALPNGGPEFAGASPLDAMIEGGLPKIVRVRRHLDSFRGSA